MYRLIPAQHHHKRFLAFLGNSDAKYLYPMKTSLFPSGLVKGKHAGQAQGLASGISPSTCGARPAPAKPASLHESRESQIGHICGVRLPVMMLLLSQIVAVSVPGAGIPEPTEVEFLGSYFGSPLWDAGRHQTFDFAGFTARADWPLQLGSSEDQRWEFVGELLCARVVKGFDSGGVLVGPSAGLRFWLLPKAAVVSPYIQGSVGAVYTDAYRDRNQDQLGEALEFRDTFAVGSRIRLSSEWSGVVEFSLNHLSDGGLSRRNCGVNALGVSLGFEHRL